MTGSKLGGDVLAMEGNHSHHAISFDKNKGCYVSRGVAVLLGIIFVSGLVVTGLLVYYYAPQVRETQQQAVLVPQNPSSVRKPLLTRRRTTTTRRRPSTVRSTITTAKVSTTPIATTKEESPKGNIDVRLPRALKPLHYLVKLQPFINGNFSIIGYVEVEMEALEPTSNITLHMADIITRNETITLVPLGDLDGPGLRIKKHEYDNERQFYVAHLEQELQPGHKYLLSMEFLGYLNDQLHGFYRSSYRDTDGTDKMLAVTQFQATDARRAFPCFDEPGLKATFEVYLARTTNMSSISNMPISETIPMEGEEDWVWDHYDASVPMSTYLVAFVVSDFAYLSATANNHTLFRVWARESAIEQAEFSRQVGPIILTHFEDYFNQSYPLPKQDMVAIPDFSAGAMENWGLITYRETAMLFDPAVSAASNKQYVVAVVAHELAHQWFGNIVTPRWWTDLWLNEGFASYVEYFGINYVEPSWQVMEQFVLNEVQIVFGLDSLESSHPISIPVGHPDEISQIFDRISYAKGASIIRMMNHFLTEATFRKGLSNYLDAFKYDNAEQDDLWRHLTEAAHEDGTLPDDLTVKIIMDTWTLQMGYPVVSIARAGNSSAVITQEHFLLDRSSENDVRFPHNWWIPVTYTTQDKPDFDNIRVNFWLNGLGIQPASYIGYPQPDQWIIFNVKQTGYYRVNYDEANWELLTRQLQENHEVIHVTNRAQLIDDALNLARAGHLSYRVALGVISYLAKERHYVAWKAAFNNLQYLRDMFYRDQAFGALKDYLVSLILPVYRSVGFEERQGDDLQTQLLRGEVMTWACNLGHPDCRHNALQLFRGWMADPENFEGISANVAASVYCTAIRAGGEDEWNFAWRHSRDTGASNLADALSCTEEIWLLARYLEGAFNASSGIRRQNAANTFRSIAAGPVGNILAWDFLRSQWSRITNYIGATFFALPTMIEDVTKTFNTAQQLKELVEFDQENVGRLLTGKRAVLQAVEVTKINVDWMEKNRDLIVDWLENQGFSCHLSGIML